jgi:hypothetical protein
MKTSLSRHIVTFALVATALTSVFACGHEGKAKECVDRCRTAAEDCAKRHDKECEEKGKRCGEECYKAAR